MTQGSSVIPGLRYSNPESAVEWLCRVVGFKDSGIFRDETGTILHAQLSLGSGMIMLGPESSPDLKHMFCTPDHLDGKSTQAIYVVVDDADAHYACAVEADAKIIKPIADADFGGRGYTCCDPEGHVWEFGTYDPWSQPV